jgi:CRP-like cAMP-binding protein
MFEILGRSPLFNGLESQQINTLIAKCPHQVKSFTKNEVLAYSGEVVDKAMIILSGRLQGEMVDFSGNNLKIEDLNAPQMVAPAFLYGAQGLFPVNLSASSDGKLLVIYRNDFTKLLTLDPRVLANFLNIISGKAQFLSRKITFLSFKTIKEKLAYFLLNRLKNNNMIIPINHNQKEVAELFGVARPSLARIIGDLESQGILKWERNQVTVLDLNALQSILK